MTHTLFSSEFAEACAGWGCPFCALAQNGVRRHLRSLLHEYVLAPDIHLRVASSHGFCNVHGWLLQRTEQALEHNSMGTAILYASVLKHLVEDLDACLAKGRLRRTSFSAAALLRLRPDQTCLACEREAEIERHAMDAFIVHLTETGCEGTLAKRYADSGGACLPHLGALLQMDPPEACARWLVQVQRANAAILAEQLEKYAEMHDVKHKGEPMGAERDSCLRAIEHTVGKREVPLFHTAVRLR